MPTQWWYALGDARIGPVSADEVRQRFQADGFSRNALVWREGFANWRRPYHVPEFRPLPPPPPPAPPPAKRAARRWSLWLAALIGFALTLASVTIVNLRDGGQQAMQWLHARPVESVGYLAGLLLGIPLIFVLVMLIRNRFVR